MKPMITRRLIEVVEKRQQSLPWLTWLYAAPIGNSECSRGRDSSLCNQHGLMKQLRKTGC
eukprot:scaffold4974_cov75-Cylindrotheca_fusiformis.AAC.2